MRNILKIGAMALAVLLACGLVGPGFASSGDVYAPNGMVSSAHELASRAGVQILKQGGNAVDAAVAVALALNVVEPNASGIGGGGFMTIRTADGKVVVVDYRETAPASAAKDMFASEEAKKAKWSVNGGKAVAVPGFVAGMFHVLEKYGTMSFAQVAQPAIELAEKGFKLHPMQNQIITDEYEKLQAYNDPLSVPFFKDGLPMPAGELCVQKDLARTLRVLASEGKDAFYNGPIGEALVQAVNRSGGNMTMEDLKSYRVLERKPVSGTYRGYRIYSTPPASSGGTHVVELLNILENFPMRDFKHNSFSYLNVMAEAMKLVYADRGRYMADTAFVKVPIEGLTSKGYAQRQAGRIDLKSVMKDVPFGNPWDFEPKASSYVGGEVNERVSTTSFSVADKEGNIVAATNTINYFFGSGVMVPGYGIVLNDQMDDFSQDPNSVNAPEPRKRPLSSMSPTVILTPEGKPFMAVGAAGATRIITAVTQIIMNAVDFGMSMDEAIEQPRIYNLVSGGKAGKLYAEEGIDPLTLDLLRLKGHDVEVKPKSGTFGTAQGILFGADKGLDGGADSRRLGVPVGF
ncbi:MAG: gamma-glutamyltransferase [Thermanaerothrix sp.]|nr:gamma-glutamyltransferase [Thermanaerothrix sp.]